MKAIFYNQGVDTPVEGVSRTIVQTPFGTVIVQEYAGLVDVLVTHAEGATLTYTPPDDNKGKTASITLK